MMNAIRVIQKRVSVVAVVAALVVTTSPLPTRAQIFGGIVHDPVNYALQVEKRVEEAARWVQTLDHYIRIYENAVRQLTTLTGVLKTAEQHLGFDNERRATPVAVRRRSINGLGS